jgi:hypothetical protein
MQQIRLVMKQNNASCGRADELSILLGLNERLIALLQYVNGRLLVHIETSSVVLGQVVEFLFDQAFARFHQMRRELGGVVADGVPAADAVCHAQHVHKLLLGYEPSVIAKFNL